LPNDDAKMKESYASGAGGKSGGAHGPGGIMAAKARNPNKHTEVNDAPLGPSSHLMGYSGDGGMHGDASVSRRGRIYFFK
jgi:hypothetical protein